MRVVDFARNARRQVGRLQEPRAARRQWLDVQADQCWCGNATGINFSNAEVIRKRLQLLHELVPKAVRIEPANPVSARRSSSTITATMPRNRAAEAAGERAARFAGNLFDADLGVMH